MFALLDGEHVDKLAQRTWMDSGDGIRCRVVCRRRSARRLLILVAHVVSVEKRVVAHSNASQRLCESNDIAWPSTRNKGPFGVRVFSETHIIGGEFDPGSGSTLAACLMHASRTGRASARLRGGRVRNTWASCPGVGGSRRKRRVIPHTLAPR